MFDNSDISVIKSARVLHIKCLYIGFMREGQLCPVPTYYMESIRRQNYLSVMPLINFYTPELIQGVNGLTVTASGIQTNNGEGQGETAMSDVPAPAASKGRGKTRPAPATPEPNNNTTALKSERLSPTTTSSSNATTTTTSAVAPPSAATLDNNSSSSRSATPSSYPGTPPGQSPGSSPSLANRNYSDMMRSLAAKYNNTNPNDYFSGPPRNGATYPLDPRYASFKAGAPYASLLTPHATGSAAKQPAAATGSGSSSISSKQNSEVQALYAAAASHMFPPLIDMSSSQALLNMVRTANQTQLETYLKGAIKRPSPTSESSPLDLSSGAVLPAKKSRKSFSEASFFSDAFLPTATSLRQRVTSKTSSPALNGTTSRLPSTASSHASTCAHAQGVKEWTVDDVCNYVASIEECAEYAQNFRAERIDGWSLALLTESHLTNTMSMKLGPALKLRASLAARLGSCVVCSHCIHCHGDQTVQTPGYRPASAD